MGVDYALVHDEPREAYELVRSNWETWKTAIPASLDAVRERVAKLYPDDPRLSERAAADCWRFITTHPGCRVADDTYDDVHWRAAPDDDEYRKVGSMYEPTDSPSNPTETK